MSGALYSQKKNIGSRLAASLTRSLSRTPQLVTSILSDYQITDAESDGIAFHRIVALLTDIGFYTPLEIAARGWPNTHG